MSFCKHILLVAMFALIAQSLMDQVYNPPQDDGGETGDGSGGGGGSGGDVCVGGGSRFIGCDRCFEQDFNDAASVILDNFESFKLHNIWHNWIGDEICFKGRIEYGKIQCLDKNRCAAGAIQWCGKGTVFKSSHIKICVPSFLDKLASKNKCTRIVCAGALMADAFHKDCEGIQQNWIQTLGWFKQNLVILNQYGINECTPNSFEQCPCIPSDGYLVPDPDVQLPDNDGTYFKISRKMMLFVLTFIGIVIVLNIVTMYYTWNKNTKNVYGVVKSFDTEIDA